MISNEKGRPIGTTIPDSRPSKYVSDSTVLNRKVWARALIDKATRPVQRYGSPEWCALALDDPNRVAAVVIAAEAWAWDWENLEENLRVEVEGLRAGFKRAEDAEYARSMAEHRRLTEKKFGRRLSSFEERRAAQLQASAPRPGDFLGRRGDVS